MKKDINTLIDEVVSNVHDDWPTLYKIRYVYLAVGKELMRDTDFFLSVDGKLGEANLSSQEIIDIYNSEKGRGLAVICKSASSILKMAYDRLGIHSELIETNTSLATIYDEGEFLINHWFLAVYDDKGKAYFMTLTPDLGYIQMNMETRHFASNIPYIRDFGSKKMQVYKGEEIKPSSISRDELQKIDIEIGYIKRKYLYNRCHLIGYQLTGENANEKNLITGTRYLNSEGMLPFENMIADYIDETDNHVLYRVTPIFKGDNLLASGVQIGAYSVEDKGKGVSFNVYCYNVQPGITIDYTNGDSKLSDGTIASITLNYTKYALEVGQSKTLVAVTSPESAVKSVTWYSSNNKIATVSKNGKVTAVKAGTVTITAKTTNGLKAICKVTVKEKSGTAVVNSTSSGSCTYVLNTNTKKFHLPSCSSVKDMKDKNKQEVTCSRDEVIDMGYVPCKHCNS